MELQEDSRVRHASGEGSYQLDGWGLMASKHVATAVLLGKAVSRIANWTVGDTSEWFAELAEFRASIDGATLMKSDFGPALQAELALLTDPSRAEAYAAHAITLKQGGRIVDAERLLAIALTVDATNADAFLMTQHVLDELVRTGSNTIPACDLLPRGVYERVAPKYAARKFPPAKFLEFDNAVAQLDRDAKALLADATAPPCEEDLFRTPEIYLQSVWFAVEKLSQEEHARYGWRTRHNLEREATFVLTDKDDLLTTAFLQNEFTRARWYQKLDADVVDRFLDCLPPARPIYYVFHTSLCGSTLMSRGLDEPGVTMAYREPILLHEMAIMKRIGPSRGWKYELNASQVSRALSRSFDPNEAVVIKPSETCNNIARELLLDNPGSKALLLYGSLPDFLLAVLHDPARREYIKGHRARTQSDLDLFGLLPGADLSQLNDGQLAVATWLAHVAVFRSLLDDPLLADSVVSLPATTMYHNRAAAFRAAADYFRLPISDRHVVESADFYATRDTKMPKDRSYNETLHHAARQRQRKQIEGEIGAALEWYRSTVPDTERYDDLPRPLLPPPPTRETGEPLTGAYGALVNFVDWAVGDLFQRLGG